MLSLARKAFDLENTEEPTSILKKNISLPNVGGVYVFFSIYFEDGKTACLVHSSASIQESIIASAQNTRAYCQENNYQLGQGNIIELSLAFSERIISINKESALSEVNLGLDSISILSPNKEQCFLKSTVPLNHQLNTKEALSVLILKAGYPSGNLNEIKQASLYKTIQFRETQNNNYPERFMDTFRGDELVLQTEVTKARASKAVSDGIACLERTLFNSERLFYSQVNHEDNKLNHDLLVESIRTLATTHIYLTIKSYENNKSLESVIDNANVVLNLFLDSKLKINTDGTEAFLSIEEEPELCSTCFLLRSLLLIDKKSNAASLIKNYLINLAKINKFASLLYIDEKRLDYFKPFQYLLALLDIYADNKDDKLLSFVASAIDESIEVMLQQELDAIIPLWFAKAYEALARYRRNAKAEVLLFKIGENYLKKQNGVLYPNLDIAGSFGHQGCARTSAVVLEVLLAIYNVLDSETTPNIIDKLADAIISGCRFLLQNQISNCLLVTDWEGGFRTGTYKHDIRIDNIQHCLAALDGTLRANLFVS